MFKKILLRSFVGTTVLSSALAVSLVANPAATSAPELRTVDNHCEEPYPGSVTTSTDIDLRTPVGVYGAFNTATATVSASEDVSDGTVRFVVTTDGSTVNTQTRPVNANGVATISLPRYLKAASTYTISATYVPEECSVLAGSSSSPDGSYTVYKRGTQTVADAPSRARGRRPVVKVAVDSGLPRYAQGKVRIAISRRDNVLASRVVGLNDGSARALFRTMRPGRYDVAVRYLGARNFRASSDGDGFRIRRGS